MHQLLLIVAVSQTFFAALILILGKSEKRTSTAILLGSFVFVYGISFLQELDFISQLNANAPILVPFTFFFYFLIGPTFYFYVKDMTKQKNEALVGNMILHIMPIIVGVGLMSAWVLMSESERQVALSREFWPDEGKLISFASSVFLAQLVSHIQIFCYLMASLKLLNKHLLNIREIFSNLEDKTLGWLRLAIFAIIAIWFIDFVTDIGYVAGWFNNTGETLFTVCELVIFYFVTICGLRQPTIIFNEDPDFVETTLTAEPDLDIRPDNDLHNKPLLHGQVEKYAKSALDETQMTRIANKLEQVMENEHLFSDNSLTLSVLSKSINTPQNYVSQTLNQKLGLKFYDYVARHRVQAAKVLLADNNNTNTILSIALDVGFNSKSTFNAAFKRFAGSTPSQFRLAHRS